MNFDITAKRRTSVDSDRSSRSDRDPKTPGKEVKTPAKEAVKIAGKEDSGKTGIKDVLKSAFKDSSKTPGKDVKTPAKEAVKPPGKEAKTPAKAKHDDSADDAKKLSDEDIQAKLAGYMPVPKRHWGDFGRGDHIRWINKEGVFNKGGFVRFYYETSGVKMVSVESIFGGSRADKFYTSYSTDIESPTMIYKKIGVDYHLLRAQFGNEFARMKRELIELRAELDKTRHK